MQAIVKRALLFKNPSKPNVKFHIKPSTDVQSLPEWIRDTPEFKYLVKDPCFVEVAARRANPAPPASKAAITNGKDGEDDSNGLDDDKKDKSSKK